MTHERTNLGGKERRKNSPPLSVGNLRLELVNLRSDGVDLVSSMLLRLVLRLKRFQLVLDILHLLLGDLQSFLGRSVLLPLERVDLDVKFQSFPLEQIDRLGFRLSRDLDSSGSFIEEIDSRVGESSLSEVLLCELSSEDEGGIEDSDSVVDLKEQG